MPVAGPAERAAATRGSGRTKISRVAILALCLAGAVAPAVGADGEGPALLGIPIDFLLFGATVLGVVLFHHHTLSVALTGLATISAYKLAFTGFKYGADLTGLALHLRHESVTFANLLCLLLGFALLSRHFEKSRIPAVLPHILPHDWRGGFFMLVIVFVLSSFLDNIAAALMGGAMAHTLFRARVHIGYLAAIVAASNAGGAGSVVGDTTTTMMWIDGVKPTSVLQAYVAAAVALILCGIPAAIQQHRYSPMRRHEHKHVPVDWPRVGIVALILGFVILANVTANLKFPEVADRFPIIGVALWLAILVSLPLRRPDWEVLPEAVKGSVFLLSLVTSASMMPVEQLPLASWQSTFGLGFVSAAFDNIPLTALALRQGGYDWGFVAYAVGFGGSMIWFGSSAGVALSNMYTEAKSVGAWLRHGWHVTVAYVVGFFVMLVVLGWHPDENHKALPPVPASQTATTLGISKYSSMHPTQGFTPGVARDSP